MEIKAAFDALSEMPRALESRIAGLSERELRFKPGTDTFSVLENVCHLRDIEVDGYALRLQLLLTQEYPLLPDINGSELAEARRYNSQAFQPALQAFVDARHGCLGVLANLTPADLAREGHFENVGDVTLGRLLELWVAHDRDHIKDLDDLLAVLRDPARNKPKPSLSLTT
ncbi:MAG TPA: DinB family protein [Gammaproteobacteria bacterium]|nr:DinB family protein [Gammaproteobacteria bacterium]